MTDRTIIATNGRAEIAALHAEIVDSLRANLPKAMRIGELRWMAPSWPTNSSGSSARRSSSTSTRRRRACVASARAASTVPMSIM